MAERRDEVAERTLEERIARLEGLVEGMDRRISNLRDDVNCRLTELWQEIRELRNRFWWLIGILITMWVTIILTILLRG